VNLETVDSCGPVWASSTQIVHPFHPGGLLSAPCKCLLNDKNRCVLYAFNKMQPQLSLKYIPTQWSILDKDLKILEDVKIMYIHTLI